MPVLTGDGDNVLAPDDETVTMRKLAEATPGLWFALSRERSRFGLLRIAATASLPLNDRQGVVMGFTTKAARTTGHAG